jgi:hypothetical protein
MVCGHDGHIGIIQNQDDFHKNNSNLTNNIANTYKLSYLIITVSLEEI